MASSPSSSKLIWIGWNLCLLIALFVLLAECSQRGDKDKGRKRERSPDEEGSPEEKRRRQEGEQSSPIAGSSTQGSSPLGKDTTMERTGESGYQSYMDTTAELSSPHTQKKEHRMELPSPQMETVGESGLEPQYQQEAELKGSSEDGSSPSRLDMAIWWLTLRDWKTAAKDGKVRLSRIIIVDLSQLMASSAGEFSWVHQMNFIWFDVWWQLWQKNHSYLAQENWTGTWGALLDEWHRHVPNHSDPQKRAINQKRIKISTFPG